MLQGVGDSQAEGLMRLVRRDDGAVQFAIAAQNVPPNEGNEVYAVWLTREGGRPRRLGFAQTPVGEEGILTTGGPQQGDEDKFPQWFATYEKILITRETDAKARRAGPGRARGDASRRRRLSPLRNASPSRTSVSLSGARSRQMQVARRMAGDTSANDSSPT